jgi:hypothetical protein
MVRFIIISKGCDAKSWSLAWKTFGTGQRMRPPGIFFQPYPPPLPVRLVDEAPRNAGAQQAEKDNAGTL